MSSDIGNYTECFMPNRPWCPAHRGLLIARGLLSRFYRKDERFRRAHPATSQLCGPGGLDAKTRVLQLSTSLPQNQ